MLVIGARAILEVMGSENFSGVVAMKPTLANWREFAHIVRRKVKAPRLVQVGDPESKLSKSKLQYPPYPYGEAPTFKQSDRGLYGGKILQFGHKISDYGNKHVRIFRPNVQKVTLWSETLKRKIPIRVVASVLKTITNEGGLDNYLIKDTPMRIKQLGVAGWNLRYEVLSRMSEQERTEPKPVATGENGEPIFGYAEVDGAKKAVLAGRTRLLKLLHAQLRPTTLKAYLQQHETTSFQELVDLCRENGIDISKYLL